MSMKNARHLRALQLLKKAPRNKKWLFILIQGSLLRGGVVSLIASILMELSYSSYVFNALFFSRFPFRFLITSSLLMLAGLGLGHWLWTLRAHRQELTGHLARTNS